MDMILVRRSYRDDGIFGLLTDVFGEEVAMTLEHSYPGADEELYRSKIPIGNYVCIRGIHQLHNMEKPFTTFEITNVKGHSNILFHWGNYNQDSDGCVLLGETILGVGRRPQMITNSKVAFQKFMALQSDSLLFNLIVMDEKIT